MRICMICKDQSVHVARRIRWLANRGHQVYLITHKPGTIQDATVFDVGYKYEPDRSRIQRYLSFDFHIHAAYRLKTFARILRMITDLDPDILHLQTLYFPAYFGVYSRVCPLVISAWNGDIIWKRKRTLLEMFSARYGLKRADVVTATSLEMRNRCIQLGAAESKVHLIHFNAVDLKRFNPQIADASLRTRLNLGDSPVVLSTRSFVRDLNIHIILQAIPFVVSHVPDAQFLFASYESDEEYCAYIRQLIDELQINSNVRLVGCLDHGDLPQYHAMATVYVSVPSIDNSPASLVEAMACGATPIVSALPSVMERVTDGWNGYVVPVGDARALASAITRALTQSAQRKQFVKRNLQLVQEELDYDKEMAKMEKLYETLLRRVR